MPQAKEALEKLVKFHDSLDSVIFACDTEVANIDVSKESPCGHGNVICFSIYARGVNTSSQKGKEEELSLWVDTMGKEQGVVGF